MGGSKEKIHSEFVIIPHDRKASYLEAFRNTGQFAILPERRPDGQVVVYLEFHDQAESDHFNEELNKLLTSFTCNLVRENK